MGFFGQRSIDERGHDALDDFENVLLLVLAFEQRAAHAVDRLALLVHDVVVFEHVFARGEILRFDGLLRGARCAW